MTEKQNSVKTCTGSLKKETTPIYGTRCSFDQKKKSCPFEAGMNRLKSNKSSNLLLWKFILQKLSSTAATRSFHQLLTYPTTGEISQQYLLTIRFRCSTFIEIELIFPLQESMYNYKKSVLSPYDPTKLAIHSILRPEDDLTSNCGTNVESLFLLMTWYTSLTKRAWWLMQILIVVLRSSLKLLKISDRSTEKGITFLDPVKIPNAFSQQRSTYLFCW